MSDSETESAGDGEAFVLPEMLDLGSAESLVETLCQFEERGGGYGIDASAVGKVSTAALQAVLAVVAHNEAVRIQSPSDSFMDAVIELGLLPQIAGKVE